MKLSQVTERARKLRAQYALQAQSLRTRVELRINRIPTALRKANIGELFEKYLEVSEAKQTGASKGVEAVHSGKDEAFETSKGTNLSTKSKWRGTKRSRWVDAVHRDYSLSLKIVATRWNLPTKKIPLMLLE